MPGLPESVVAIIHFSRVVPELLWVYDYLLTLHSEVDYCRKHRRWSVAFLLFLVARYFPLGLIGIDFALLVAPPQAEIECAVMVRFYILLLLVVTFATEALLLLRMMALWSLQRRLSRLLVSLFTSIWIVITVAIIVNQINVYISVSHSHLTGCITSGGEVLASVKFALVALFEIVIVGATAGGAFRRAGREKRRPIYTVLRQGNLLYSVPLCLLSFANAFMFAFMKRHIFGTETQMFPLPLFSFQSVMHSIVACRVLFEVQRAEVTSHFQGPVSMSDIDLPPIPLDNTSGHHDPISARPHSNYQPVWSDLGDQQSYNHDGIYKENNRSGDNNDGSDDDDENELSPLSRRTSWSSPDVIEQVPRVVVSIHDRGEGSSSLA
ncbi:hypothetical protein CONPUDRAFT_167698 [Coniophora puteana RWD-64-598 SS2]|uniref:DUF6533 domain-containing protein n=1 Tax=Coniophora puteana (strain RWD-64-598) TaxID=741705 RepID=A0A5M3ME52_CONPW|nr:uncharacterized protein CONPUDRAFT_167698 [Coniophora puteana RWD-64-598 SS2]EIW77508.1 hypothetical protein CONPUDRAFT_167698 [Coniophora puteana RWD-64-598 SS2]